MDPTSITLGALALSFLSISVLLFSVAGSHRDLANMKKAADRKLRLQGWAAEEEFLRAERPNSLDPIVK